MKRYAYAALSGLLVGHLIAENLILRKKMDEILDSFWMHNRLLAVLAQDMSEEGQARFKQELENLEFQRITEGLEKETNV